MAKTKGSKNKETSKAPKEVTESTPQEKDIYELVESLKVQVEEILKENQEIVMLLFIVLWGQTNKRNDNVLLRHVEDTKRKLGVTGDNLLTFLYSGMPEAFKLIIRKLKK